MSKKRKSAAFTNAKVGVEKPEHYGIPKGAEKAWRALSDAQDQEELWNCKDNSYFYVDYDGKGFDDGDNNPKPLTEDQAAQLCFQCPLLKVCYDYAVAADEKFGVYGGIDFETRLEIIN